MKSIAIGISLALSVLTIPGYGQKLDSIDSQYLQSKALMEKVLSKKFDDKALIDSIRRLSEKNEKIDFKAISQGGVDSGGGTLVRTAQTRGLLDLYLYNYKAFNSRAPGVVLPNTPSYTDNGFDALVNSDSSIIPKTLAQVAKWNVSSPTIANLVTIALIKLPIYYVKSKLLFKDKMVFVPANINFPEGAISLGAYYIKDIGVFIEKESFDRLSLKNQMGLLVHEALRHRQLSFESGMSNEIVQKVTSLIMSEPQPGVSLDNVAYLQGPILQKLLRVADLSIRAKKMADDLCNESPGICPIMRGHVEEIIKFNRALLDYHLTAEFFERPSVERDREIKLSRHLMELKRTLFTLQLEMNPDTVLLEDLNFSLKNSLVMFRMAAIAQIYNEIRSRSSEEAKALKSFISGMKQMGVIAD